MAGSGLDPALIGNYCKQIQCISLSLQPTPALIVPDTAAAHHGNGALDQILTASRAWTSTRRMVITVMIYGSNGVGGCHSSGAMGNFDIWPTMEWRVGPLYLVCAAREADVRLSSLTEKIRLV